MLAQLYPTTLNEVLVNSEIVGILGSIVAEKFAESMKSELPGEDDIDQSIKYAAEKAQESVNEYSVEQIDERLNALNYAKAIAIETGSPMLMISRVKRTTSAKESE